MSHSSMLKNRRKKQAIRKQLHRAQKQARREGADTEGLDGAIAESDERLAEARRMVEEADDHIRAARLQADRDPEAQR